MKSRFHFLLVSIVSLSLIACTTPPISQPMPVKLKIALVLGGGAAKGFAHVGVIKMLEAQGIVPDIVVGTSAGSVVGSLYAAGYSGFQLQELAFSLDEKQLRDVSFATTGLIKGEKLQDYINQLVQNRPIEKLNKPFGAVATNLATGSSILFQRGNTGQAVRASSSIPGVFQPTLIAGHRYVDGGVISPVPVESARKMGANFIIAVDISAKANGFTPTGAIGIMQQSVTIMGQKMGATELAAADIILRPRVGKIGAIDFEQRHRAILEGEKVTLHMMPEIKRKLQSKLTQLSLPSSEKRKSTWWPW
jgi:NTE family protein